MDIATDSFGGLLRRRRKALDLTQEQLADRVACSRYTIRKLEADERRPSRHLAERLLRQLAVPPHEREDFLAAARGRPTAALSSAASAAGPDVAGQPPFVGRDAELARLGALLAPAGAGRSHVALIEGEPGIGKSRLLAELAALAALQHVPVLGTRCYRIERTLPYQPVVELLTQALAALTPAALQRIAPVSLAEIATLVPDLATRTAVPALSTDFPEARQARLFRALGQCFELRADRQPLVVIVDDLQWADAASLQFLHWLARQAAHCPLRLVCAYRDEDVGLDERLAALVASLRHEPQVMHLPLARLDLAGTQALLQGHGGVALAERLHRETEGLPFFLVSLMQAVRDGSADGLGAPALPLPDALRAALRARLAQAPTSARTVLDVAAVLGRHFDLDTLLDATGAPEAAVLDALEALTARRLLREDAEAGVYDFSHDKLREVAYLELGSGRRVLLHRSVAETLERAGAPDARLAEHYECGRAWPQALACMRRAGERSQQLFATREALRWFDRAIALAHERPEALQGVALAELHDRRGAARAQAGQTEGAVADLRCVIDAARQRGDRLGVRDALIRLGMTYRRADRYPEAIVALDEALRECHAMGDERRAADTLYHLGTVGWSDGRNADAIACHEQAVAICERLGLTDLVAVQAYHGRGEAHFLHLEPRLAIACYERSLSLARAIGEQSYECENQMMLAYACTGALGRADYARAEAGFHTALAIAERADLQWHLGPARLGLDHVRACTGRYGEAWTGMQSTLSWLQGLRLTRYELIARDLMACLLLDLGLHQAAADLLQTALATAQRMSIRFWQPRLAANLAIASMRLGRRDVGPQLQAACDDARRHGETTHLARGLEGLAELAWRRGDGATALAHADALQAATAGAGLAELAASARRWRGEALGLLGQREAASAELACAAGEARALGRLRLALDATLGRQRLGASCHAETGELAQRIAASTAGSGLVAALSTD